MAGTILFGIDVESANENTAAFVEKGIPLFEELSVPVTWYVTGKALERYPDLFQEADRHPLIDLQGHTYDHILLKSIWMEIPEGKTIHDCTGHFFHPGESIENIDTDLEKCQSVFENVLGRRANGLTAPWNYYRGLADRPDLLEIVRRHGFLFLRSFGRNETDGQPVPLDWEPFSYADQGFPEMVELLIHDYQDDFYWRAFTDPGPEETYPDHMVRMVDRVAAESLVWSACSHDHHSASEEGFKEKAAWFRAFILRAKEKGVRFLSGSAFYSELLGQAEGLQNRS